MPNRTDETPLPQQDRDRQPGSSIQDEPRDFETMVSDDGRNYDASFDSDLNPIEDEDVNTHGSER
ncbi:MAG TPA: hypothetical protein VL225_17555 [Vicinamibacterales bacterium]|jgi:hypothetical protein|nr:hypothetical protein [Vicinamibacterales bacterium]